jgi:hypothetical protein
MELSGPILFDLLFRKTLAGYLCIGGLIALAFLFFGKNGTLRACAAFSFWILAWTMYDVFGYDYVVLTNGQFVAGVARHKDLLPHYQVSLNAYRIIQMTFQWTLSFLVVFAAGWRVGLAANLVWWGANCDILYYVVTFKTLPQHWTWLGWTPVGIFTDTIPLAIVIVQAIALIIVAGIVMRWHCRSIESRSGVAATTLAS